MHRTRVALLLACVLAFPLAHARADASGPSSGTRVIREALRASGETDPTRLARYEADYASVVERIAEHVGTGEPTYRRARRFHRAVHEIALRRYDLDAGGIPDLLDNGSYNCVTSTLFYGAAARALGFDVEVVESPRHVFLRMRLDGRVIDVETTSPRGFDMRSNHHRFRRFLLAYKLATPEEIARRGIAALYEDFHGMVGPVSLEDAVSFLWHNSGERWLEEGFPLRAARAFEMRFRIRPEPARRSEALSWALGRAFRTAYDAGRFEDAYEIARIDLRIFPGRTTVEDRLLATALKRIELACDRGETDLASSVLEQTRLAVPDGVGSSRLTLEALPEMVAAAVRAADWDRALRFAGLYTAVEPDPIEAGRLLRWIERRRAGVWVVETEGDSPKGWSRRLFPAAVPMELGTATRSDSPGPLWGSPIANRPLFRPGAPAGANR